MKFLPLQPPPQTVAISLSADLPTNPNTNCKHTRAAHLKENREPEQVCTKDTMDKTAAVHQWLSIMWP